MSPLSRLTKVHVFRGLRRDSTTIALPCANGTRRPSHTTLTSDQVPGVSETVPVCSIEYAPSGTFWVESPVARSGTFSFVVVDCFR